VLLDGPTLGYDGPFRFFLLILSLLSFFATAISRMMRAPVLIVVQPKY
jgi:hypothetical protein